MILVGGVLRLEEGRVRLDVETMLGAPCRGLVPSRDRGKAEQALRPG